MVRRTSKIDIEWAESLIGLRMKVANDWWVGYGRGEDHDGKIASFDEEMQRWILIVDTEPHNVYPMAYQAVYLYADEGSSSFGDYQLPEFIW